MIKMNFTDFNNFTNNFKVEIIELGDNTNKTIVRIEQSTYIGEWLDGFVILEAI